MLDTLEELARINNLPLFPETDKKAIGEGGFGVVYASQYKGLKVAIKDMKDIKVLSDVKKEIQNLVRVRHPNIPKLYGLSKSKVENGVAFLMEFIKGKNIDTSFDKRSISLIEKLVYFYEMVRTVDYIHGCGLIHRDLKPENLMIIEDNLALKLLDFGIARRTLNEETKTVIIGTPKYMAPENYVVYFGTGESRHLVARTTLSPKNDVWALGLIISELYSREKVWNGVNDPKPFMMRGQNFPIPEKIKDHDIRLLISESTSFSPNKRCDIENMRWKLHQMVFRLIAADKLILEKQAFPDLKVIQCKSTLMKTI